MRLGLGGVVLGRRYATSMYLLRIDKTDCTDDYHYSLLP